MRMKGFSCSQARLGQVSPLVEHVIVFRFLLHELGTLHKNIVGKRMFCILLHSVYLHLTQCPYFFGIRTCMSDVDVMMVKL